ncbi:MAG: UPF0182 family membrane protein [Candidatus Limnocylindria bacterium]
MSSWFDRLLEELQKRQQEQDARREGRPRPRPDRPRAGNGRPGAEEPGRPQPPWMRRGSPGGPAGPIFPPTVQLGQYRRWIVLGAVVVVALVVIGLLTALAGFVTDLMWYDALGRRDVLLTRLAAQIGWFVIGFALFAIPAIASIVAARRLAPRQPVRRLDALELPDASRAITTGLVVVAVLMAIGSGAAWSGNWQQILLFLNGGSFGTTDPNFGHDIGYYIFGLPLWRFVQGWAVASLVLVVLLTAGAYAAGALRWQLRLTAPVRAHLSILGALLLIAIAGGYQLDIASLSYSTRAVHGSIQAAMYTDLHAQVPAYVILTVVALVAAGLLLANIWFRTLWLILLAVGAWLVLGILVGGLYPAIVQRITVEPGELQAEQPYITQNIAATRAAFGLDAIGVKGFTGEQPLTRQLFTANQATLQNVRLWDYRPLLATFDQQQVIKQYYTFRDVDIDRYRINGVQRQIMLAAREIGDLPANARTWTNERLVYSHGYGITAVPVNAVTPEGQPDYLVGGINQQPQLPVTQPRIYFGEGQSSYVVVGTRTSEFDYPVGDEGGQTTSWSGSGAVGLGNPLSRLLFAVRFGDLNLLISNQLTDRSQILFRRSIGERVRELAPFLTYDRDPYIVNAGGRLVWLWDAYTTSDHYPNAQPLADDSPFPGMNYVRNSVKVAIDAYDGSVRFYIADPTDPMINAYARIFPSLFAPISQMPPALREHVRYPEDLFTAQNEAYLLYHVAANETGARALYNQDDRWAFASQVTDVDGQSRVLVPYYVIMKIPGESQAEFVLIQPVVAARRPNMVAWVAARMDAGHYGERISFRFPAATTTLGPAQIQSRINQDSTISAQFTLWSRAGSTVVRGDLLVLPMGDSILYVEPIFLQSTQSAFPEFKRVILASQSRIAFAETFDQGLRQILGESAVPPPSETGGGGGGGTGGTPLPADVASLVARAQQLYSDAQAALRGGDLAGYQAKLKQLNDVLAAIARVVGTPAPSPSAAPSGSPAASPGG